MSDYAAEIAGVTLRRGDVVALNDVSLSLPVRETTAILGGSGSGKSTLIQLVMGLLTPDVGEVRTLGEALEPGNLATLRKRIGYAIQEVALLPHMSIRSNILLPAVLSDWPAGRRNERLGELIELMQLPVSVLDRYPHELSGGQQQRAGLCRALILGPELLLLDEPFSGLDTMTRRSIHEVFLEMRGRLPISIVLVTHDPEEAAKLADNMVVMRQGELQQFGTVDEVLSEPANDYVRDLCTAVSEDAA